jgi:hypothetical protein
VPLLSLSDPAMRTGNFMVAIRQRGIVSDWNVAGKRKVREGLKRREEVFTPRAQFFHKYKNMRARRSRHDSKGNSTNILQTEPSLRVYLKK